MPNAATIDDFSTLFDFLPIGAYRSTPAGAQLRANPALVALNGYATEAEQLAGVRDIATEWYVDPARRAQFARQLERDGFVRGFVSEIYRHKTRERIWVSENSHAVRGANGAVLFYEGTVEEVTDRIQAEAALRDSEERWKLALDSSGDGVWDWDLQTGIETYSQRFRDLYGYAEHEFGDRHDAIDQQTHPDDLPQMLRDRQAHFDGHTPRYANEHRVRCRDGSWKWILSRGLVIRRDADGRPLRMIGTHTDITARKQAEALRQARDRAEAGERAKTEWLSRISHELRTPLNAVLGFAQLLDASAEYGERQRAWVRQILTSGQHLLGLVDDVLDLSTAQSGNIGLVWASVDPLAVVADGWAPLAARAQQASVRFDGDAPGDTTLHVLADRNRLRQVVDRLLSNAIKFNRAGGQVTVRAARRGRTGGARRQRQRPGHGCRATRARLRPVRTRRQRAPARRRQRPGAGAGAPTGAGDERRNQRRQRAGPRHDLHGDPARRRLTPGSMPGRLAPRPPWRRRLAAMLICPSCGEENPPKFRLCGYCGAALATAAPAPAPLPVREMRKTVTIVFSDLKDSTALGERIDTEALHEVKERYFGSMAAEIVRHGGKVEKYIGDAIMAVFGLPKAHEDDALRAVRAAHGMRVALDKLNEGLRQRYGVALANRTGINTGEVVANDDPTADQKLATGDAVNVAARLEQAAPVDQIYLGETTWRLVRDAVEVEAVEPLALKGKSERVAAYRLVAAAGLDGNVRRIDTPLAGRDEELAVLLQAWQTACTGRTVQLVTVIGDAGVGKSRLVHEAIKRTGDTARVLRGRCLPYGDGITFWPLVEIVGASAGIDADDTPEAAQARVLALTGDADVTARLASAIGLSTAAFPMHELYWAARRFLQGLAQQQPVVALIDDIHWAEPAFLELLEHVLDAATDTPILLLATARHELIEERPTWPDRPNAARLVLRPLSDAAAAQVVTHLLGSASLAPSLVARIVAAAEGNPLYVEQMLSMLIDSRAAQHDEEEPGLAGMAGLTGDGDDEIAVPPTIHALLEARLDRLGREERATVEPAAVVGLEFPQPAVESLAPAVLRAAVPKHLASLSHKHFIKPADSSDAEASFRFHHHLVRETVYNGLLKRARATLHVEFVRWQDRVNAESERGLEHEEILGYHLEQAHRYLSELGPLDEQGVAIGVDAARRLGDAGRRAFARADMHAAVNLFQRASRLVPARHPARLAVLPVLGESLMEIGDFAGARAVIDEAEAAAIETGDARLLALTRLGRMFVHLYGGEPGDWGAEALRVASESIASLESTDAHNELASAWRLTAFVHGVAGRYAEANAATVHYMDHASRAGNKRLVARSGLGLANGLLPGVTPVLSGIEQCERIIADLPEDRQVQSIVMCIVAQLRAMNGEFDAARTLYRKGRAFLRELGQGVIAAQTGVDLARVELLAGDLATAEREVRADCDFLAKTGESYFLSTVAAVLSRVLREQGRDDEALALSKTAETAAAADDVDAQVQWRSVRAPIVARMGDIIRG